MLKIIFINIGIYRNTKQNQKSLLLLFYSYSTVALFLERLDYAKFAPPHSYIDVKDFKSPQHLAEYLNFLIENPEEYLTYFWWKDHYVPRRGHNQNGNTWCELCRKLNNPDEPESVFRNYDSFQRCDIPAWAKHVKVTGTGLFSQKKISRQIFLKLKLEKSKNF